MRKYFLLMSLLLLLFILIPNFSCKASDIQLGGQLNASITGFYDSDLGFSYLPQANLDWELFLPSWNNHEIKCAGYFYTDLVRGKVDFFWKRLYWKHRFDNFHLTIGRQPISWSFGSLLNPVDYSLGAVALDRDYSAKYQDAIEVYYPVNWHTSLSLVASLPGYDEDVKVGIRGRTLIKDFDVTIHFVQEQALREEPGEQRFGMTAKGDIGLFGVYSALGYYQNRENPLSFLVGFDYSHFFQAGNQLYFQAEYLNIPPSILSQITGSMMSVPQGGEEQNIHLLVGNVSYQIDEFSNIGLTSFFHFGDGSRLFLPAYSNQLSTHTTVKIQAGMMMKQKEETESSFLESFFGEPNQLFVEIGANYAF